MDAKTAGKLIATGLGFGCVHVLTGADHLSALATLSVGSRWRAFSLGIRWGLGHSTGLILVAAVLLGLDDRVDPTKLEHYCNWIVGVFMIGLGVWGVFKAVKHKRQREAEEAVKAGHQEMATAAAAGDGEGEGPAGEAAQQEEGQGGAAPSSLSSSGAAAGRARGGAQAAIVGEDGRAQTAGSSGTAPASSDDEQEQEHDEEEMVRLTIDHAPDGDRQGTKGKEAGGAAGAAAPGASPTRTGATTPLSPRDGGRVGGGPQADTPTREPLIFLDEECESLDHAVIRWCKCHCPGVDIESPLVQRIVAFSIGIIHGIAGPGGILGVLPAVQLHSWQKASLYLGTFCFASTLIMGVFAAVYGEVSSRIGSAQKIEFQMEIFSASLSIIVGILWIALIIAGKLNVVFG